MRDAAEFVALMRRYVEDYTDAHDVGLIPQLMHPDYRIHLGSTTLGFAAYRDMVEGAYAAFPDLGIVAHEIVTNGDRLGLRFSEFATSARHDGRFAVWEGIGLYRRAPDGRLAENFVDQDFYGRREQLAGVRPAPARPETSAPRVWEAAAHPPSPATERTARRSIGPALTGTGRGRKEVVVDGVGGGSVVVDDLTVSVDDLFTAGRRFGLRATLTGRYRGTLHGVPEERVGTTVSYTATALGSVAGDGLGALRVVTDRYGLAHRLRRQT